MGLGRGWEQPRHWPGHTAAAQLPDPEMCPSASPLLGGTGNLHSPRGVRLAHGKFLLGTRCPEKSSLAHARGEANITPLALSPAPGIIFPSGFDFHLPLGDLRGGTGLAARSSQHPNLAFTCPPQLSAGAVAASSSPSGTGGLPRHGTFSALPAGPCLVGRVWGRRRKGRVHCIAAPALSCLRGSAVLCPSSSGTVGDTGSPPHTVTPVEMFLGSAGLLSPPVPAFPCWT